MIESYEELNDTHIDVLKEIGNIGAGNAATSLGVLLDEDVSISVPDVRIEELNDVVGSIGAPDEVCVAVLLNFMGEANGVILFLMTIEDAKVITNAMVYEDDDGMPGLSEMKLSGVKELGNILASSYIGSVASLTGMKISLSPPHIAIDMMGAILAVPVTEYGAADSRIMFACESFATKERRLGSHVIMFTDVETLTDIMGRLGLDV
ncbi:MAG: chemotaxis protein CheC [Clostridiales Family XIII bacterium]|jgi:chemotaxis protein CheC|nr:chemotaxis protein CheC [Clostridiales Family XIII bacterium]